MIEKLRIVYIVLFPCNCHLCLCKAQPACDENNHKRDTIPFELTRATGTCLTHVIVSTAKNSIKNKNKKTHKKNAGIRLCFLHYNVDSVNMVTCCKHWCQIAKTFLGQNATCSGPSDSAACPAASQIRHQHLVKVLLLVARKIACCSQMITDERWRK